MLKIESEILSYIQKSKGATGTEIMNRFFLENPVISSVNGVQFLEYMLEERLIQKELGQTTLSAKYHLTPFGVYSLKEYTEQQNQTAADKTAAKRQKNVDHVLSILSGALAAILSALVTYFVQFLF